ncbi:MAG: hypothetical protein ABFS37_08860 [Acidobacteriota bacterium]
MSDGRIDNCENFSNEGDRGPIHGGRALGVSRGLLAGLVAVVVPALVFLAVIGRGYDGKPFLRGDCPYYVAAARSIAKDGDLDLGNQLWQPWRAHNTNVALDQQGRLVPKHPLWMSVAVIPFLHLFGDQGALVFNVMQLLLLCVLMFTLARRVAGPWPSAVAVCLTATLSFLPHFAWNFSPDVFAAVLLLGALVILPKGRTSSIGQHILAGVLLGVATTAKPSFALAALALPLLLGKPLRKTMVAFALGGLLPVVLWLGLNQHLFGHPLVTPYDRIVHFTEAGIELHSNREDFTEPLWRGARDQIIRPGKGLLPTSPITVVSFLLLPLLWFRGRRWAVYTAVTSLGIFFFYSTYAQWVTSHWGNRFLMPVVVLGVLPLAAALGWRRSASENK